MANALYGLSKQGFGDADIDWSAGNIKALLVDTSAYTVSINVDQFLDDISGSAVLSTSGNLASKTNVLGVMDSDSVVFVSVPNTGDTGNAIVFYEDSGTPATSPLIAYFDTAVSGLPVTPDGSNVTVNPNASGWFTL
jgi:hypothetical protein